MIKRLICYLLGHVLRTPDDVVCVRCGRPAFVPPPHDRGVDFDTIDDCPHPHHRRDDE